MMPKKNRLEAKLIQTVARVGKKKYSEDVLLKYIKSTDNTDAKFAISISKKIDNKAVIRNKIKRIIKSILIDMTKDELINLPNNNYLFIVLSKKMLEKSYIEFKAQLYKLVI